MQNLRIDCPASDRSGLPADR